MGRTQADVLPVESCATKTRNRPSGERRGQNDRDGREALGLEPVSRPPAAPVARGQPRPQAAARPSTATSAHARRSRGGGAAATGAGTPAREPALGDPLQLQLHVVRALEALVGVLGQARRTSRSSAGGGQSVRPATGAGGCGDMIAAISAGLALALERALPVAIS